MNHYAIEEWYADKTFTVGGTWKDDLATDGILSALLIEVQMTAVSNATLGGGPWRVIDWIDQIRVIQDGSREIVNVNAHQLEAAVFYNLGIPPGGKWANYASQNMRAWLLIPFGRYPGDPGYGLNLGGARKTELQLHNTSSSTYHNAATVTVQAMVARGRYAPAVNGYFKMLELRSYQSDASEQEQMQLVEADPVHSVFVRAQADRDANYLVEAPFGDACRKLKVATEDGGRIIYEGRIDRLAFWTWFDMLRLPFTGGFLDATADKGHDMGWGRPTHFAGIAGSKDGAVASSVPTITGDEQKISIQMENREADCPPHLIVGGVALHETVPVYMARQPDLSDCLMPGVELPLRITTEPHSAAANNDTDLEVFYRSWHR
jgi:hypothetical protein